MNNTHFRKLEKDAYIVENGNLDGVENGRNDDAPGVVSNHFSEEEHPNH